MKCKMTQHQKKKRQTGTVTKLQGKIQSGANPEIMQILKLSKTLKIFFNYDDSETKSNIPEINIRI